MKGVVTTGLALLAFVLQVFFSPVISLFGAKPEFIIILIVCAAFFSGELFSPVAIALFLGIALDTTLQGGTYINTGIYLFIAVMGVVAGKLLLPRNLTIIMLAVGISGLAKYFLLIFILYAVDIEGSPSLMILIKGLPSIAYTVLASLPCFYFLQSIYQIQFMKPDSGQTGVFLGE